MVSQADTLPDATTQATALAGYGQLPLAFEPNQGQTNATSIPGPWPGLHPVPHARRGRVRPDFDPRGRGRSAPPGSTATVMPMGLVGASTAAPVAGGDLLPGTSNYFVGNDPSRWRTNIPNFGQVAYRDVYAGFDLVYHGDQQQLEYDFQVAPGASPGRIALEFPDATAMKIDGQGNLILHTPSGDVSQNAPVVYQEIGGVRAAPSPAASCSRSMVEKN